MIHGRDAFHLLGTVVAEKYRIDEVLGEGGYGVVYGGEHLLLHAPIALKCMKSMGATAELEERATQLFLREARVLFELSHPGIVRMYDVGTLTHDERRVPWVVLERLEGHSLDLELHRRAAGTAFTRDEIAAVFEPVLEALAFAHARGVVHRDLKPSNLMLQPAPDGTLGVKVLDFGVARWAGEQRPPSGLTGFTPAYAAPEQWDDDLGLSGPASDVFSLGLILAELCTLSQVFPFTSPARILRAILDPKRRVEVLAARPDLPSGVDALIARATDIDPAARPEHAGELLGAFRSLFALESDAQRTHKFAPARAPVRDTLAASATTAPADAEPIEGAARAVSARGASTAAPVTGRAGRRELSRMTPWLVAAGALGLAGVVAWRSQSTPPADSAAPAPAASPEAAVSAEPTGSSSGALPDAVTSVQVLMAGDEYDAAALDKTTSAEIAGLRRCYLDTLERDPEVAGRALVLVAVSPTGKIHSVADFDEASWVERVVRDAELRACLRTRVTRWSLPTHDKGDLAGLVLIVEMQPRPRRGIPPARELSPEHTKPFESRFVNKTTGEVYAPTFAKVRRRGDVVSIDYPDGALACVVYGDESMTCRWLQTDYQGGSALAVKPGGSYQGTWGYWPSDSDGGSWKLSAKKP